ncbi:MAG: ribose-phosphate diphosphokinase [Candidatus Dadabacteria bacterium]|nr:ribose-phosphate diphosphokinase [Candidatus Dadabacteria bacterium]
MEATKIFSGNSNVPLGNAICEYLNVEPGDIDIHRFSDGEIFINIRESVRGDHVFIIQSTCPPVNEHIMELLIITDALKRASAREITAVIPYFGYARQDRKVQPRAPISAKLVSEIILRAGVNRLVTVDLHAGQIQGFFDVPVDHIYAAPIFIDYIKKRFDDEDIVIVSPDAGGMERARAYAKRLNATLAMTDKRRSAPNVAEIMYLIGDVKDKTAIIVDDMVDTAGTAVQAAKAILDEGAKSVSLCCTHGVLSGNAIERINDSAFEEVIITDTIPPREDSLRCEKIKFLSIANLLGEAIKRITTGESISKLFN